ncbi:MAG: chemotaxis protein CheW [Candidatus Coatesbacteria bacterium]
MDDLVRDFLAEADELLAELERDLLLLERDPANREGIASAFRALHTLKGSCGIVGFARLEALAHAGEDLLAAVRDGSVAARETTGALLALLDAVRGGLGVVRASGGEGDADHARLLDLLARLARAGARGGAPASESVPPGGPPGGASAISPPPESRLRVDVRAVDRMAGYGADLVKSSRRARGTVPPGGNPATDSAFRDLDAAVRGINAEIGRLRLGRVGRLWSAFPRVVRDLAAQCGKEVRLVLEGAETGLDRVLLERIKDPLTHLVRNAVDHGIETPEFRREHGKYSEGTVTLRAFHSEDRVCIEVADDGAGIDPDRLKKKALDLGLILPEVASGLSGQDALRLVFLPGFSTAAKVTSLSGRGVGMDVVMSAVQRVGGDVEIESVRGAGTTVRMRLPAAIATMRALVVTAAGARYVLPESAVVRVLRLSPADARAAIGTRGSARVIENRGHAFLLLRLGLVLGCEGERDFRETDGPVHVVLVRSGGASFGIVVDEVVDGEEIVMQPVEGRPPLGPCFSGATIMSDGAVALIVDVNGIAPPGAESAAGGTLPRGDAEGDAPGGGGRVILVEIGGGRRAVVPLLSVDRIARCRGSDVTRTGATGTGLVGGGRIPLVFVGRSGASDAGTVADLDVLVCGSGGGDVGLAVDRVLDVVDRGSAGGGELLEVAALAARARGT